MNTKTATTMYHLNDTTLMERMIANLDRIQGRMPLALKDDRLPDVIRISPAICGTHVCVQLHDIPDWSFGGDNWEVFESL